MALYEKLTATSSPAEIAAAYKEFTGLVGGDTQDAQTRAVDYLTGLGISAPTITQAYDQFLQPVASPLSTQSIANTSGVGSTGIGVGGALIPTSVATNIDTGAGGTSGALSQVANNTAGATNNNVLGGIILGGDSFLSGDKAVNDIAAQTGQVVTNTAIGGQTSSDVLNQLNTFTANGGTFAPGATVILNVGGNDLLGGIDPATVQNNINSIVSRLGGLGVNVVLSGASNVGSVADVTGSTNLAMSDIYNNIANSNSNVTLVDSMSGLLNQKNLVDDTGFHLTAPGQAGFNTSLSNAYLQSIGAAPISFSDQNIINFARDNNLTADQAMALAPSFGVDPARVQQLLAASTAADSGTTGGTGALSQVADTAGLGVTGIGVNTGYEALGDLIGAAGVGDQTANATRLADQNKLIQELYTEYLGPGRVAEQEGLDYWRDRFGPEIDASEREQFRQAATTELTKNFGEGDAGLLAGFKYAKDLGVSDDGLKSALGEDLYNQYQGQLKNFATTNISGIVADNQLTWDESQKIHNFGRDLGFTPDDLARMTGQNKSLFELADTTYKAGRDQIINSSLTAPTVTSDADRVLTSLALQDKFGFTDKEISAATGVDVDTIKSSLDPVRNFSTTFSSTVNSPDTTTDQIKTLISESRGNAAINKMYGDSLNSIETKINGLEQKWSSQQGVDPLQAENLFNQLEAQKNAIGGQYYSGVFGDTMNMAATLNRKGLETIDDLGQKDKFQTESAYTSYKGPNGESVQKYGDGFVSYDQEGTPTILTPDQVTTSFNKVVYDGLEGEGRYVPLSAEELATLKDDGTYQAKIGTVVIDKDTGKELTNTDGVLAMQRSGGKLTSKKHYINVGFTDDGRPILTASQEKTGLYGAVSELAPMVLTIASFIPGPHQPFARLANAALALEQKNYLGAVLSGLSAAGSFAGNELTALRAAEASGDIVNASQMIDLQNTLANVKLATTFVQGAAALQAENLPALINAGLSAYAQIGDTPLPSGVTTAVQLGNLGIAIENKQYDQALNALGDLTGSQDIKIAGSAKTLIDEFSKAEKTGDFSGVINAGLGLVDAVNAKPTVKTDQGGITNRVVDDNISTVSQGEGDAGAAAFAAAKSAGASDEDALAAANAVTGVVINKIPDAGPSNVETKTYTQLPPDQVVTERTRLAQDYASSLGKPIDKLTTQEVDDFVAKVDSAIAQNGSAVLKGASIQDILSGNYQKFRTNEFGERAPVIELTNLIDPLDAAGNVINMEPTDAGAKIAGNVADSIVESITGLEGTTGKIVQQGLSTLLGGIGEQVADLSTSLGNMGLVSRNNAGVTAGKYLEDIGKRLQLPETKLALENWVSAVDKEPTYFGKIASGVKGVFQNPLVLTEVVKEIGQEILPGALALRVAKYAGLAAGVASSTVLNALESAGSTGRQTYDEEIAKGTPPAEAAQIADRKAGYAGIITLATSGITDAAIAKKYGAAIEDFLGKKASSTGGEFVQEGLEEGLIALATGKTPAEALTQSVVGSLVGSKTSGTIQTAADVQADLVASFASQGLTSTDGSFRAETIVPVTTTGNVAGDVASSVGTGDVVADTATPTDSGITLAVQSGDPAAVNSAITGSITTAAESGADVDLSIASTVSSAVGAGADVNTVIAAATEAATSSGNNVSITSDASVVTINNATTNTNTTVNTATGVTTSVNSNTGVTTVVDAKTNTTTTVDANTNIATQITVNPNTNVTTNTTVDSNNNTTTQTTFNPSTNTQTTVLTDVNTNTQTTINVNIDTGEVIDQKETSIPDGWKQPVIESPVVPPTVTPPTVTTPTAPTAPTVPKLAPKLSDEPRTGAGGFGLPVGMTLNPASLRSRETQKAIDPLARVKEIQAEFERDAMIQNVDPRLMQILQQRSDPQQQSKQFDEDIGALAKLLGGKPDAPTTSSDASNYYSYGSEDSIDDVLGGKVANYKEGGFVEPLKASGGSMALPLLAKSGGALGHYKGRENFKEGKHVAGEGDGQSDDIPAWLADGEFVFPADVVSALGNGSTKAGTDKLYEMMHSIRDRARSKGPKDLPPPALKSPLDYLKSSKRSTS
jgi:hypothetical protein